MLLGLFVNQIGLRSSLFMHLASEDTTGIFCSAIVVVVDRGIFFDNRGGSNRSGSDNSCACFFWNFESV